MNPDRIAKALHAVEELQEFQRLLVKKRREAGLPENPGPEVYRQAAEICIQFEVIAKAVGDAKRRRLNDSKHDSESESDSDDDGTDSSDSESESESESDTESQASTANDSAYDSTRCNSSDSENSDEDD
ncbi:hypothetical protein HK097_003348 [Rhizophlyctis rosea]|uniref:Uncharacterized protein n=1 Tax=Rhizophlyctis rosea TaxID=64517 RepID=A0AAD5S4H4_9FUNG|nr:hypothetical protein HK097_003348 [Rhizophlyctis rosea]